MEENYSSFWYCEGEKEHMDDAVLKIAICDDDEMVVARMEMATGLF